MAHQYFGVVFALLLILSPFTEAYPTALKYSVNQEFDYNLNANVDARGTQYTGVRTAGSFSTMKAIAASMCTQVSGNQYLFVFNMFNTDVEVGDTVTRISSIKAQNDAPQPLGYDMYFQQDNTGKIIKVYYQQGDDPYFVQVKLGAINSFQTSITAPQTTKRTLEEDPVGEHYSSFLGGTAAIGLLVNKTYSEKDFQKFPDANVKSGTFSIIGKTSTAIHEKGYIYSSSVSQYSIFNRALAKSEIPDGYNIKFTGNDTTGFDLSSSSNGILSVSLAALFENGRIIHFPNALSQEQLDNDPNIISGTMMEQAARFLHIDTKHQWLRRTFSQMLQGFLSMEKTDTRFPRIMQRIARLAREYSSEEIIAPTLKSTKLTPSQKSRLFAILAIVSDTSAENVLIEYGLRHYCPKVRLHAIFAANSFIKPSTNLLLALNEMYHTAINVENRHPIIYAMGAILNKDSIDDVTKKAYGNLFVSALSDAIKSNNEQYIIEYLNAIGNAGPSVVPLTSIPVTIFDFSSTHVRLAAIESLRKYSDPKIISILTEHFTAEKSEKVRQAAASLYYRIGSIIGDISFPFNQSWSKQISFGGKEINVVFNGLLFAGTNFDCNHPTFNYEGHTKAEAVATAFGESKSAFLAEALYGKENGQLIGDKLYLRFWDNVLYDKTIPIIDCNEHVSEIAHTAFGFSVSYTLWVSVIPVTFRASALLQLDLKWGWNICDNQLSALVELIPSTVLTLSGGAEINLLIIKAGVALDASFNAIVKPQAFVHGTQCQVGFDALLETIPMNAAFVAYFAEKECKYLFFDCHWGKTHEKTLWSWQLAPKTEILFNKVWNIKP